MRIGKLERHEVCDVWEIDRSEVVDGVYRLDDGRIVLRPEHYEMRCWPPGEEDLYGPILLDCHDRGGTFYGAFAEGVLAGVVVLESRFIGSKRDRLQLKFLHVGRAYRGRGLGTRLFGMALERARKLGARRLYISSTPSEHTIRFYLSLGCRLAEEIDPELHELEPDDMHLEYLIT